MKLDHLDGKNVTVLLKNGWLISGEIKTKNRHSEDCYISENNYGMCFLEEDVVAIIEMDRKDMKKAKKGRKIMKLTRNKVNELVAKGVGLAPYERFVSGEATYNPLYFDDEYNLIDSSNDRRSITVLINTKITKSPRFKNREEMHEKLKELADGFKPDWSDINQSKTSIVYSHSDRRCTTINSHSYQHSLDTVYFKSRKAAQKAIDFFTDEEWKMYFEAKS